MAKTLSDFDFGEDRVAAYPWDQWLDGRVWRLEHGVDVHASLRGFQAGTAATAAARRGLKVRTRLVDGGKAIVIQAYKP